MKALLLFLATTITPLVAQLRIQAKDFGIPEPQLRTLFEEVIDTFPGYEIPPTFVSRDQAGPVVLYQRTPRGEIAMLLDTGSRYYCQYLYQFSHELAHIRANFQRISHEQKWLEETLCETASLYTLAKLSLRWEKNAPPFIGDQYHLSVKTYLQNLIESRHSLNSQTSPAYYQKHRVALEKDPLLREINGAFAALLLPFFLEDPKRWVVIETLPRKPGLDLQTYFETWQTTVPEAQRDFLSQLETLFLGQK